MQLTVQFFLLPLYPGLNRSDLFDLDTAINCLEAKFFCNAKLLLAIYGMI